MYDNVTIESQRDVYDWGNLKLSGKKLIR